MTEPTSRIASLADYSLLGRTGLRVSPLCLGTMTFGTEWGWGAPEATSRAILAAYLEAGGNFVDTADGYTNGSSETIIGTHLKETGTRDRVVLATKFAFSPGPGDPNAGGNARKNIYRALEGSLRRLQTDYIDLYWLHAWDGLTPVEEVIGTLTDLVRAGKVRYIGLSDARASPPPGRVPTSADPPSAGTHSTQPSRRRSSWRACALALRAAVGSTAARAGPRGQARGPADLGEPGLPQAV
ncbi:MAG: aldo/keto reductase [Nannocystis sp.]|nr:aldo/keto reductase [Nannocystis sp.]MBK7826693.1 aldo/keto reductase [Nannocystis sp.]